jgi:hypothetical protein
MKVQPLTLRSLQAMTTEQDRLWNEEKTNAFVLAQQNKALFVRFSGTDNAGTNAGTVEDCDPDFRGRYFLVIDFSGKEQLYHFVCFTETNPNTPHEHHIYPTMIEALLQLSYRLALSNCWCADTRNETLIDRHDRNIRNLSSIVPQ